MKNYLFGSMVLIIVALVLALANTGVRRTVAEEFKDVRVINTESMPALVRDIDHPAREPFQMEIDVQFNSDELQAQESVPITVPPGKRFVMEHVSATGIVPIGQKLHMSVAARFNNALTTHALIATPQGNTGAFGTKDIFTASQPLRAYVGGANVVTDQVIVVFAARNSIGGEANVSFGLSGYFIDVP